jgi:predicted secreted protein
MMSLRLTRADAGEHYEVRVGTRIEVRLDENPGTGYRWESLIDPQLLRQVGDRYEASPDRPGAPGTRVTTLEAVRPGRTELRFVRRRAWETSPTDEFLVHIEITP